MDEEKEWEETEVDSKPREAEKAALVSKELEVGEDNERYSAKRFIKARSFRLGLIASVLVLFVVVVIVAVIVGTLTALSKRTSQLNIITLDDVFDSKFQANRAGGSWLDDQVVFKTAGKGVFLYDPATSEEEVLISPDELASLESELGKIRTATLSPAYLSGGEEDQVILLEANSTAVYRHSRLADYYLYSNSSDPMVRNLTKPDELSHAQFQYVAWSPNGERLAYVLDYDIYVVGVASESVPIPITTGGTENGIVYGIPDWVYEEEVISDDHALWWSPDSQKLLFAAFDDSLIERYSFPVYGSPEEQYTTLETIAYPKSGATNPTVNVYVSDVLESTPNNVTLFPGGLLGSEHYMAYAGWMNDTYPYVGWLNRTQTYIEFCIYTYHESTTPVCQGVTSYELPGGWIEQYDQDQVLFFTDEDDTPVLLTLLPRDQGDDSSTHLGRVRAGDAPSFLTGPGLWEVTSIVGHYQQNYLYISTERSPLQRHLYSYDMSTTQSYCLSCDQSTWNIPSSPNPALPDSCDYFDASCDSQLTYCILDCRGPCVPYSVLARYNADTRQLQDVELLQRNQDLRDAIASKDLPKAESFTVPNAAEGPELNGVMWLPPGFDSGKKYPVLVYVYGGPYSQVVSEVSMITSLSRIFFASNLNIILASVDGRGTGFRGNNFKFSVYKDLGNLETVDLLRGGRYLQSLSYVDSDKLAIYGASYGGYMAGRVGSSGSGVYSAAISQSPVSDWLYYDSIYTERYMIKPFDNMEGYQKSSILPQADRLGDVDYLLIHGTGDDNVHYQNTLQLAEALTEADVQFQMMVYTDQDHSLSGGNTRRHLYQLITNFLRDSFNLQ